MNVFFIVYFDNLQLTLVLFSSIFSEKNPEKINMGNKY